VNATIGAKALTQIKEYALAIARDERFRNLNTRWTFWVISNDLDATAQAEGAQANRPRGVVYQSDTPVRMTIWAKPWSEVLEENRMRLNVFQQRLEHRADQGTALAYLRARPDVDGTRVGLQGWSNGGSATLAAMAAAPNNSGFTGALVFYPACGLHGRFEDGYKPYAATRVFMGTADEEVSPKRCKALVDASNAAGGDITIWLYPGATHSFDDPGAKRQKVEANADATDDAVQRATKFFAAQFAARAQ